MSADPALPVEAVEVPEVAEPVLVTRVYSMARKGALEFPYNLEVGNDTVVCFSKEVSPHGTMRSPRVGVFKRSERFTGHSTEVTDPREVLAAMTRAIPLLDEMKSSLESG
jgi:hypothetical protein